MTLISSNIKNNIIKKLDDIINIEDPNWSTLCIDLKLKIVHNMCSVIKNNLGNNLYLPNLNLHNEIENNISIPLKNQRPKKLIELGGINKQTNSELFNEFRRELVMMNRNFRKKFNSKNKCYSFANLSEEKFNLILNDYNQSVYKFINKNINKLDTDKLFNNLMRGTQHKVITPINSNLKSNSNSINRNKILINKITCVDKFINIEFNNQIVMKFELYLTSEKITSNIPAKYKIYLINIF